MISLQEALAIATKQAVVMQVETVDYLDSQGRILAENVFSDQFDSIEEFEAFIDNQLHEDEPSEPLVFTKQDDKEPEDEFKGEREDNQGK